MNFEAKCIEIVKSITTVGAYFFNGTMFLETEDSQVATKIYSALYDALDVGIIYGLCGQSETAYDFV